MHFYNSLSRHTYNILDPPSASIINITSNNISLPDGSVMTLFHCTSDGSPSPNITWTYNNSTRLPNGIDQVSDGFTTTMIDTAFHSSIVAFSSSN